MEYNWFLIIIIKIKKDLLEQMCWLIKPFYGSTINK